MRILIVGNGSIGKRHLSIARSLFPTSTIKVFQHSNDNIIPATSNGLIKTLKEAIDFSPNIAVIANPAPFHIRIALALTEIGAHLLVEKPLSNSISDVELLIKTCNQLGLKLAVGYNLRFSPSLIEFRRLLNSGAVGKIYSVSCEGGQFLPSWRPEKDYRNTVSANKSLGGGVLLELSHEIDYLYWIFGEIKWIKATLSKQSNLDIDVEDTAILTMGISSSNFDREILCNVNLDFVRHDPARSCTVIGENGTVKWDGLKGNINLFSRSSEIWSEIYSHSPQRDETYIAEWKNFLSAIDCNNEPLVTGEDGLKVLHAISAARESALNGTQIYIGTFNKKKAT
jgi:predicted dehydrogenase